jgi:multiple sugar transport system permease protein
VALLLNLEIRARRFFRVVAILPWTMPDVVGGLIWRFMFDTLPGIVNAVLLKGGLVADPIDWLGVPSLAFASLIIAESWRGYPFVMLILLAGMQAIPVQQYEAAELDGASKLQAFCRITIPNLRPRFFIALVLDTIWECRLFGMVFSMTGGGPGISTQVLSLLVYKHYFQFFNVSYAAAIAVVLACFMLAVSLPYLRMTMKRLA